MKDVAVNWNPLRMKIAQIDCTAEQGVQIEVYSAPGDRKVVALSVDGVTVARVTSPANQPLHVESDRDLTVLAR